MRIEVSAPEPGHGAGAWLSGVAQDVRFALRALRRSPGFCAVTLLTLALGIGANTAVFSILHAVVLRPLGYPAPGQLMRLTAYSPDNPLRGFRVSTPEYLEFRAMSQSFSHMGAFSVGDGVSGGGSGGWAGAVNLTAGDHPLRVRCALVDDGFFATLGVQPERGRVFAPGETDAMSSNPGLGGPPVAILSHELWQSAFGGRPIVGHAVTIDGRPHDVIGIMPPGFDVMDNRTAIWLPIGIHPVIRGLRENHILQVVGRLRNGVSPRAASAELATFLEDWGTRAGITSALVDPVTHAEGHVPTAHPSRPQDHSLRLQSLRAATLGDTSRVVWTLQAAAGLVLLIACANLGAFVLVRAEGRRREFAVRAALGASRGRIFRQAVTEGTILSLAGGAIGVWVARFGLRALVTAYPASLPRTGEVSVDLPVLVFALLASLAAGVLFGATPALGNRLANLVEPLKEGQRDGGGAGRHRIRRALAMAEVACAVMLAVGATLLLRTVGNLTRVDAGFDRARLVTFSLTLPRPPLSGPIAPAIQRLLDTVRAMPGVHAATAMSDLPFHRKAQRYNTGVEHGEGSGGQAVVVDYYQFVMSDYFETMGIPLVAGRSFNAGDTTSGSRVAVVSETLARRLWGDRNPIGQRVRPNLGASIGTSENPWHTVIGVARDVKEGGVDQEAGTELYLFIDQPGPPIDGTERWVATAPPTMHIVMRTSLPPSAFGAPLERAVHAINPAVPLVGLRDMEEVFDDSIGRPSLVAHLLSLFAGLALLLALVGTYGVLSFMVVERRREIAVRVALGATQGTIVALITRQGIAIVCVGLAAGLAGALGAGRLVASLLFGVQPTDAFTLTTVAAAALVATLACMVPAWRASRVDPNVVLRGN